MALLKFFDSTGDTTIGTGTGSLVGIGTPPTGYINPAASTPVVANNDNTLIRIANAANTSWEVCETVVTVSVGVYTYSRGTLITSSTGSRISFTAGTQNITFVTAAEYLSGGVMTTAGDILYSDGRQPKRLPAGSNGQILTLASGVPSWGNANTPATKAYAVTIADCTNTVTETDVVAVSIPANDWADGDEIVLYYMTATKNNSGGAVNATTKTYWGATEIDGGANSIADSASEGVAYREIHFIRIGTTIYYQRVIATASATNNVFGQLLIYPDVSGKFTSVAFSSTLALKISVTFGTANALTYHKTLWGRCVKTSQS